MVGMNVTAHQEYEKNEETKTGKRKAEEGRKQATDFKEAVRCPIAVVQGAPRRKNYCARGVPEETGNLGKANSHFDQAQTRSDPHHHVEVAANWCSKIQCIIVTVMYYRYNNI